MLITLLVRRSVDLLPMRIRRSIRRIPLVNLLQRSVVRHYLDGRSFVHSISAGPARGVRMDLTLPGDKLFWTGTWELSLATAIQNSVKPGYTCCDIGSYRGYFAGVMAMAGAVKVHCFEPNSANLSKLETFCALNPNLPIEIHPLALGNRDGEATFIEMADPTMGKLSTSRFASAVDGVHFSRVRLAKLDTLIETTSIGLPNVIKIDVEGAELEVLLGAAKFLSAQKPRLFIETHSRELNEQCSALLKGLGYRVASLQSPEDAGSALREISHLVAEAA